MKHTIPITLIMLALFLGSQLIGLLLLQAYVDQDHLQKTGEIRFERIFFGETELERPETTGGQAVGLIAVAIVLGTALLLLLMRFQWVWLFRLWFFSAIFACLSVSFSAFLTHPWPIVLAGTVALWRIIRPDPLVHNLSELFLYGGLAIIFVPLLTLPTAIMLLLVISAYDMYAVWRSKHMVHLATFQSQARMFAGMAVPYSWRKAKGLIKPRKGKRAKVKAIKTAILGGGDMGFPLLFAGTVFKTYGFYPALIVPLGAAAALAYLFFLGEQDRFYPAMPYITAGCFVSLGVLQLVV